MRKTPNKTEDGSNEQNESKSTVSPSGSCVKCCSFPSIPRLDIKESGRFAAQAVLIWVLICVPGNIVTAVLLRKHSNPPEPEVMTSPSTTAVTPTTTKEPICYESLADYGQVRKDAKFWLEGIGIAAVGLFGLFGNVLAVLVLRKCPGNRSFNILLIW